MGAVTILLLGTEFASLPWLDALTATLRTTALISFTVFSIEMGVIALLEAAGMELDMMSMVFILMTVGFAVDSTAHVALQYEHSSAATPTQKSRDALAHSGVPILQASVSTALGVSIGYGVRSYFSFVFATSVIASIAVGVAHGLLVLPLLYSLLHRSPRPLRSLPPRPPSPVSRLSTPAVFTNPNKHATHSVE